LSGLQAFCAPRDEAVTASYITNHFDQFSEADTGIDIDFFHSVVGGNPEYEYFRTSENQRIPGDRHQFAWVAVGQSHLDRAANYPGGIVGSDPHFEHAGAFVSDRDHAFNRGQKLFALVLD